MTDPLSKERVAQCRAAMFGVSHSIPLAEYAATFDAMTAELEKLRARVGELIANGREVDREQDARIEALDASCDHYRDTAATLRCELEKARLRDECWKCGAELLHPEGKPHCEDCPRYDESEDEETNHGRIQA